MFLENTGFEIKEIEPEAGKTVYAVIRDTLLFAAML